MFSTIAHRYDLLNKVLSLGIDRHWRRFAIDRLPKHDNARYIDVATGTCDVALEIVRRIPGSKVSGVDFSEGMLELGKKKVIDAGLQERIEKEETARLIQRKLYKGKKSPKLVVRLGRAS